MSGEERGPADGMRMRERENGGGVKGGRERGRGSEEMEVSREG